MNPKNSMVSYFPFNGFTANLSEYRNKASQFFKKLKYDRNSPHKIHIILDILWMDETKGELKIRAEEEIKKLEKELEKEGFRVETEINDRYFVDKIAKIAENDKIDQIYSHESNTKALLNSVLKDTPKTKRPVAIFIWKLKRVR